MIKSGTDVESILSTGNSIFANQVVGFVYYPIEAALKPLNDLALLQGLLRGSNKKIARNTKEVFRAIWQRKYLY